MSNFDKVAASPETLGKFLSSIPIATGPWDELFHRRFCYSCIDSCGLENCDTPNCPHQAERNNPTWWLMQTAGPEVSVEQEKEAD